MSAFNFNVRGIPSEVMESLRKEAKRLKISVNFLILKLIESGLGFHVKRPQFNDLNHLAGTWSAADAEEFEKNIEYFDR